MSRTRSLGAVGAYFEALGAAVERSWLGQRNNEDVFPQVAMRVLEETPVPDDADAVGILNFVTSCRRLVPQERLGFGDPPLTLYRGRDFYISALYWLDGTTSIHQHGFAGAFRVLEGSSIHARYDFCQNEAITRRLLLGDLTFGHAELLQKGDVRGIEYGDAFIHALFHLDRPSVTIVVRTNGESLGFPQFEYFRPGVAFDPFLEDEAFARQLRSLKTLHSVDPDEAVRCAEAMISTADLFGALYVMQAWFDFDRSTRFDLLLEHLVRQNGSVADILVPAYEERKRQQRIIMRRRLLDDPSHRLFLALVLNLPDRSSVDDILRARYPGEEPGALLATWVEELSSSEMQGISGLRLSNSDVESVRAVLAAGTDSVSVATALRSLGAKVVSTPLLQTLLAPVKTG